VNAEGVRRALAFARAHLREIEGGAFLRTFGHPPQALRRMAQADRASFLRCRSDPVSLPDPRSFLLSDLSLFTLLWIEDGISLGIKAQSDCSGCEGPQPSRRWHPSKL
jgi:hypothetical protein